ncbi:hypothetical protein PoB_002238900 [Plakobranchus ocellatus]|uniref:Uncharacterized protein n=1 Tax=Plakobranchus ocellatus TaxID=259542 RepID=A0AAV3ZNC1_9GAST|nr:hypothetical protein PoB_002238900 [Plakobranchus ocellatus]
MQSGSLLSSGCIDELTRGYCQRSNYLLLPFAITLSRKSLKTQRAALILFFFLVADLRGFYHRCSPPGVGGTVACESALRSAGTFLSRVRAPPSAPRPDGGLKSLRSPCCGLALYKNPNPTPNFTLLPQFHQRLVLNLQYMNLVTVENAVANYGSKQQTQR